MYLEIFSQSFLAPYLTDFRMEAETDIFRKKESVENWIGALRSKKLTSLKEEETKSRFIPEIFGDVLGFNYRNPSSWLIREELKSTVDATKPDAALGVFHINESGIENDVHVVIEIKDASTKLDKPQNRKAFNICPVSQAFLYGSKMGGNCHWVVVSNFTEIRFYHYSNQQEYQSYQLQDMEKDEVIKELLFLFHKDRLTHGEKSATDKLYELRRKGAKSVQKDKHIIDKLYDAIYKFEGLGFVDPNFLCNISPFRTGEDHVWHYKNDRLLIINPRVTDLFRALKTEGDQIVPSTELLRETKQAKVVEVQRKLDFIFKRLRNCMVTQVCVPKDIKALQQKAARSFGFSLRHFNHIAENEMVILPTPAGDQETCQCISCQYRTFDFIGMIKKLSMAEHNKTMEPLELAYGHYLLSTDNYKKAYFIYKNADISTKGVEEKKIHYFLSKINQQNLFNLVGIDSKDQHIKEILQDIRSIDLDRSIHNELDIYVDSDVRNYLIELKENKLLIKAKEFIGAELDKLKKSNGKAGDVYGIDRQFRFLYSQFHINHIVYDAFTEFTELATKAFHAVLLYCCAETSSKVGISEFYLTEAILYANPAQLVKLLAPYPNIPVLEKDKHVMIEKAYNLLRSIADEAIMGKSWLRTEFTGQLANYRFRNNVTDIFSNLFTILSHMDLEGPLVSKLAKPIVNVVEAENFFRWSDYEELGKFMERNGGIFQPYQLLEMLNHGISGDTYGTHKYHAMISSICIAYHKFNSGQYISDKSTVPRAIANSMDSSGKPRAKHLLQLYPIVGEEDKDQLLKAFEQSLSGEFDDFLLIEMLDMGIVKLEGKYLDAYISSSAKTCRFGFKGIINGKADYHNTTMINFIYQIYAYQVKLSAEQIELFENLPPFETWMLSPQTFDYGSFDAEWLIAVDTPFILPVLAGIPQVKSALEARLRVGYQQSLSKIYCTYFL